MRDDAATAATPFGAADAVLDSIAALRKPDRRPWFERVETLVRSRLEDAGFASAYERGRDLARDEAVELARSVACEPARASSFTRARRSGPESCRTVLILAR